MMSQKWVKRSLLMIAFAAISFSIYAGLNNSRFSVQIMIYVIYGFLVLSLMRHFLFAIGAIFEKLHTILLDMEPDREAVTPFVTILVPAYNEAEVIESALQSLLTLDYPNYEVIVIDDGSKDATASLAEETISRFPFVEATVVCKHNGGKASALNYGLRRARGDLILCVDSDSRLHPLALVKGVRHFRDPEVLAVAGVVKLAKLNKIILWMQELEYRCALNFTRRILSLTGTVSVVPGPCGLFRRDVLLRAGGYNESKFLFAEDAELTLRLLSNGGKIVSDESLVAYTEAPETITTLLRQRYRWNRGLFQAMQLNFSGLIRQRSWRVILLALFIGYEGVFVPLLNVALTAFFLTHFLAHGNVEMLTIWFFGQLIIEALIVIISCANEPKLFRWLVVFVMSKFSYGYILMYWNVLSLLEEWFSIRMNWDKLERTGQISKAA